MIVRNGLALVASDPTALRARNLGPDPYARLARGVFSRALYDVALVANPAPVLDFILPRWPETFYADTYTLSLKARQRAVLHMAARSTPARRAKLGPLLAAHGLPLPPRVYADPEAGPLPSLTSGPAGDRVEGTGADDPDEPADADGWNPPAAPECDLPVDLAPGEAEEHAGLRDAE